MAAVTAAPASRVMRLPRYTKAVIGDALPSFGGPAKLWSRTLPPEKQRSSHKKGRRMPAFASSAAHAAAVDHHSRNRLRSLAMLWLCNWHTRLSVTFSTAAISLRFMSCS